MSRKKPETERKRNPWLGWLALIAVLAAVAVFAFTREEPVVATATKTDLSEPVPVAPAHQQPAPVSSVPSPVAAPQDDHDSRIPAYFENPDQAEPLQATLDPASVKPYAKASYEVAKNKPRLLSQLPCFCYCDRWGHKSLHDCFVSNHAEECDICMKEAMEADQMESEGMSPQEIRSVIIATHQHDHS